MARAALGWTEACQAFSSCMGFPSFPSSTRLSTRTSSTCSISYLFHVWVRGLFCGARRPSASFLARVRCVPFACLPLATEVVWMGRLVTPNTQHPTPIQMCSSSSVSVYRPPTLQSLQQMSLRKTLGSEAGLAPRVCPAHVQRALETVFVHPLHTLPLLHHFPFQSHHGTKFITLRVPCITVALVRRTILFRRLIQTRRATPR
jgi:hypothetical protein